MSTQPAPASTPPVSGTTAGSSGRTLRVPPLTNAYRKAHKNYVLFSGLFLSWELIGVTLQTKEKWGIELKSPAAVPLILVALVAYSGFKLSIEWMQCETERRATKPARVDYWVAHGIASMALVISAVQYLWRAQIVDLLGGQKWLWPGWILMFGILLASMVTGMALLVAKEERWGKFSLLKGFLVASFVLVPTGLMILGSSSLWRNGYRWLLVVDWVAGFALGVFVAKIYGQVKVSGSMLNEWGFVLPTAEEKSTTNR